MRCRECATEVPATARVCPRCGAPIVGQPPPVVADMVADAAVGAVSDTAVSDTAEKAVAAGVAGHAPQQPYVPGSGDKLPAQLRLVLAGYAGMAGGLFALAVALAATAVFLVFFVDPIDLDDDWGELWFVLAGMACFGVLSGALDTLKARIRFSRLLRRRSDPRTATVTASERDGSTLTLDIIPRDGTGGRYQSLAEVRLAWWMKADMLVSGETVNVYGGSGGKSELLISSARWARAFLGALESQSALQPRLLDEKVSGVVLVDWAAWAASTTFSSTGWGFGYERREVDAFRSAVRDTFLGVKPMIILGPPEMEREKKALSQPPLRSDEVRGRQFSTHRRGYDKTQVEAFVEAAGLRLAAMESTDRPAGALISGAIRFGWAEWVESTEFSTVLGRDPGGGRRGYTSMEVDTFQEAIRDTFLGVRKPPVRSDEVRSKQFSSGDPGPHDGYDKNQVAAFLDAAGIRLAAMESTDRPAGPLVSGAVLAEWAEWADSTRFSTTPRLREGYATAEVDAFRKELRDTFLGVRQPPLTWDDVQRKWPGSETHPCFSTTRGWSRPGFDVQEVDAFLKMAKLRLAAITPDIEFTLYRDA
jgi:DivIVA domain-containing protein